MSFLWVITFVTNFVVSKHITSERHSEYPIRISSFYPEAEVAILFSFVYVNEFVGLFEDVLSCVSFEVGDVCFAAHTAFVDNIRIFVIQLIRGTKGKFNVL